MLVQRIATGLILVILILAVLLIDEFWLAPWYPLWGLLTTGIMAWVGLEMVGLLNETSVRPSGNTVFGGVLAIALANWAPHVCARLFEVPRFSDGVVYRPEAPITALAWPLWVFVGVLMFSFLSQSLQFVKPGRTMATIAGTVLATAYVGLLGSFIIQMRWLDGPYHGLIPLAALIASAKGSDIGAYTTGRLIGRRKLWPTLSPNKTVEGSIGGLVTGWLASLAVFAVARAFQIPAPGWLLASGFGLLVAASAQLGDLMESMIKRDCARKDASDTLPGFGGLLDVMDSLLFAGPVAYGYWLLFGP